VIEKKKINEETAKKKNSEIGMDISLTRINPKSTSKSIVLNIYIASW
jgi:hypothetical protein